MSEQHDEGLIEEMSGGPAPGRRRGTRKRSPMGCIAVLVALAVVVGGFYYVVTRGADFISDQFGEAEDYAGPGSGEVTFEVSAGDSASEIGRNLKDDGVVASVQAFLDAVSAEPAASGIQPGFYQLQEEMAARDALDVLIDPTNRVRETVTIPEGLRVKDILDVLGKETDFPRRRYQRALQDTEALGLPDYAGGNPEGYLFPATYEIGPNDTPKDVLASMVERWRRAAEDVDLEGRASALGYTPAELMTIASLIEAEGRGDDMPRIARVIYNRLENPDNGVTNGLLQIDATVNYALDRRGVVAVTTAETEIDSPYNTYRNPGLPPTPVEAPGQDAMDAAANPADGDWLFYVTVDLATGETKFSESYDEFLQHKREYQQYCETSDAC